MDNGKSYQPYSPLFFTFANYLFSHICVPRLHDFRNLLQVRNGPQVTDNRLDILAVMNTQFDTAVEDAILAGDIDGVDIDVHLRRYNLGDLIQHSHTVDAAQADGGIEEEPLMHIPLDVEDTIAETGLQFGGHRTVALVNLNLVLVVDIA